MKRMISAALALVFVLCLCSCRELVGPVYPADRGEGTWTTEDGVYTVTASRSDPQKLTLTVNSDGGVREYELKFRQTFMTAYEPGKTDGDGVFAGRFFMGTGEKLNTFTMEITVWYAEATFDKTEFEFSFKG